VVLLLRADAHVFPGYALIAFGAVVVPTVFIVLLLAVPWLEGPRASSTRRPFATVIGLLVVVVVLTNMLMAVSRIINFRSLWEG